MKVLHLLAAGEVGGIEMLMKHYAACSAHENHFVFLWGGGTVAEEMKCQGVPVTVRNVRRDGSMAALRMLDRLCEGQQFGAVVTHHRAPLLKLALLWLKLRYPRIRALAYAHSDAIDIYEGNRKRGLWLRKFIHHTAFCHADGVIAISESVERSLVERLGVPKEKITVIYNGIPIPEGQPVKRINRTVKLIYTGRLVPEKGVQNTITALAKLQNVADFTFDIVGGGSYEPELRALVKNCGLTDRVRFFGVRQDVPELLEQADIFVHAPDWEEGFGMAVLEAMAAGCVCVCTGRGALPELITHGVNGFLAAQDDPDALARLLETVISVPVEDGWGQIRTAAQARAREFSLPRFSEALDRCIAGKGGGS